MRAGKAPKTRPKVKSRQNVTLGDVARKAGLSISTASLVVRQSPLIPEETTARVLKAMSDLGYVYNRSAANLRTQKTHVLGMIIANIANPFYGILASGIEFACNKADYLTIFADSGENSARQEMIVRRLNEQGVAGIFLCPAEGTTPKLVETEIKRNIPIVQVMRYIPGAPGSYIGPDNRAGAFEAVNHLISLGHRRIALLSGPQAWSSGRERKQGYQKALKASGLSVNEDLIISVTIDRKEAMEATLKLLDLKQPPTAIFCFNDTIALGCMLALMSRGLLAGRDIAIVGFDDIPESALWTPSLSTVAIDAREIGRIAAELLLRDIQSGQYSTEKIIVKPQLIIRESSGGSIA